MKNTNPASIRRFRTMAAIAISLATTLSAQAQSDRVSSFDTTTENWRASTNTAALTWQATGVAISSIDPSKRSNK